MAKRSQDGKKRLPHVYGAINMPTDHPHGLCIHRAAGFVLDVPGSTLCFGTIRGASAQEIAEIGPRASTVPFIHAWAEIKNEVYAPTLIERMGGKLLGIDRDEYYAANRVRDVYRLDRPKLLKIAKAIGLSRHLTKHVETKDGASVGESLLNAAGVPHRLTDDGGIVPLDGERS